MPGAEGSSHARERTGSSLPLQEDRARCHISLLQPLKQAEDWDVGTLARRVERGDNLAGGLLTPRSVTMVTWFFSLKNVQCQEEEDG